MLIALYSVIGFGTGPVLPGLCGWAELIRPTTGMVACLWWVAYGIGDGAITLVMGVLIEEFGVEVLPIAVMVPMLLAMCCVVASALFYRTLQQRESRVLDSIQLKQ